MGIAKEDRVNKWTPTGKEEGNNLDSQMMPRNLQHSTNDELDGGFSSLDGMFLWAIVGDDVEVSFPNLSKLVLKHCRKLKPMPHCPKVEDLNLIGVNEDLSVLKMAAKIEIVSGGPSWSTSFGSSSRLKTLCVGEVGDLISLPKECASNLVSLTIDGSDMVNTCSIGEVLGSGNSLRSLSFKACNNLGSSICRGLEDLTILETLEIKWCRKIDLKDEMPWKAPRNLRTLRIDELWKVTALPSGFQHLSNLRSLEILNCYNLLEVPEWVGCLSSLEHMELEGCLKLTCLPEGFRKLTSLTQLRIQDCEGLTDRCRGPNGEDWPKIKHIPFVRVFRPQW